MAGHDVPCQAKLSVLVCCACVKLQDINPPTIADREERQDVQKLLTNDSSTRISLSAIGIGLLSLVTMLGVRLRRGLQPDTIIASSSGREDDMPKNK